MAPNTVREGQGRRQPKREPIGLESGGARTRSALHYTKPNLSPALLVLARAHTPASSRRTTSAVSCAATWLLTAPQDMLRPWQAA